MNLTDPVGFVSLFINTLLVATVVVIHYKILRVIIGVFSTICARIIRSRVVWYRLLADDSLRRLSQPCWKLRRDTGGLYLFFVYQLHDRGLRRH